MCGTACPGVHREAAEELCVALYHYRRLHGECGLASLLDMRAAGLPRNKLS